MPLLDREFLLNEKFNVPKTLRRDHDELRSALSRAMTQPGAVGAAAKRLKRLCYPHFDKEERTVYRAFALLHDAALRGVASDMAATLPLVFHCNVWHDTLLRQQQSIARAVAELEHAVHEAENSEFAGLPETLTSHRWTPPFVKHSIDDGEER